MSFKVGRRQLVSNSLAVVLNRLIQSVTSFLLAAAIARILEPYALGQYLIGFTYYFVFVTIVAQGVKTLFIRELSNDFQAAPVYLVSGSLLQLIFSILGYLIMASIVFTLPYNPETSTVCYIIGLTIIPFSLSNITEAVFQAQEKMHLMAISTVPVYVLRLLVMIWVMMQGYGINSVAEVLVLSELLILLIEWSILTKEIKPIWSVDWNFILKTVKLARTFLAIEGVAILGTRVQVLILSLLGGEVLVGLYGGLVQLTQPFDVVAQSLTYAAFPGLSRASGISKQSQRRITEGLAEIALCMALPYTVGVFFLGKDLLAFIYRDSSFIKASAALNLIVVSLIAIAIQKPLSTLLVASGFEKVNLREVVVTGLLSSLISIFLISKYQLMGAALVPLLASIISLSQFIYSVYVRLFPINLFRILVRPVLISFWMLTMLFFLQHTNQNFLTTLVVAVLVYIFISGFLLVYAFGGPGIILSKLIAQRSGSRK